MLTWLPSATMQAPVSVAMSTTAWTLHFSWAYHSASASVNRPSASVLFTCRPVNPRQKHFLFTTPESLRLIRRSSCLVTYPRPIHYAEILAQHPGASCSRHRQIVHYNILFINIISNDYIYIYKTEDPSNMLHGGRNALSMVEHKIGKAGRLKRTIHLP